MDSNYKQRVEAMVGGVKEKVSQKPSLAVILGSGLSGLADNAGGTAVPYSEIPEFPRPTVEGHTGIMHVTDTCIYMAGRFHFYEGHPMDDVVLPIFLLRGLGVSRLILTNAAGGVNTSFTPGDLVLIRDHINHMGVHPLIGPNQEGFGPRFPDMSSVYSAELRRLAQDKAEKPLAEGVYLALSGPSYETPAEINMARFLGADMVGMSTVPEAIIARYLGMEVLGISCITNMAAGILPEPLNHEEVIATGKKVEKVFSMLIENFDKRTFDSMTSMTIENRLAPYTRESILESIRDAGGHEVLCVGRLNQEGIVDSIVTAARGNDREVPALMPYMEKGDVVIHNHPSGQLKPSSADLAVASRLGNQGVGFYIIDNQVDRLYVVAEPIRRKEQSALDREELAAILEQGGLLEQEMEHFEPRETQIDMLKAVAESFNRSELCAVEAGTGVGKSIAYLIPAFTWAEKNEERIVISTATINLQQQLIDKDIPLVRKLLSSKVKTALVKGRGNYICLRRLEDVLEEDSLFREEDSELEQIRTWSLQTPTGSRSELPYPPDEKVWGKICSEADTCIGLRCRHRERCFLIKARKEAASSQILVANHHLLFSDLSMRMQGSGFDATVVLPAFYRIIFDEAHNIEQCATSFFSSEINRFSVQKQLQRLFRNRKGKNVGLVLRLQRLLGSSEPLKTLPREVDRTLSCLDELEARTKELLGEETNLRFTRDTDVDAVKSILTALREVENRLVDVADILSDLTESAPGEDTDQPVLIETRLVQRRIESIAATCDRFQKYGSDRDNVFWIERGYVSGGMNHRFVITPLDISNMMRESVFEPYGTVVCTSATLTVQDSFEFWSSRIGLNNVAKRDASFHLFPSPFPYHQRVILGIPEDAPMPDSDTYLEFINSFIFRTLEISEGKGLVLFTSYGMLKQSHAAVKPLLNEVGLTAFKQGDSQRAKLLADFHQDTGSVLFATDSFWQGVDVPGDALQVVIICRLPFRVPSEPVQKARLEAIEERGGNPFIELSLPEAVMKLKQGFGRLMRRTSDRGVVLILDPRIIRKSYGGAFLKSLPETRLSIKSSEQLLIEIEDFLYG